MQKLNRRQFLKMTGAGIVCTSLPVSKNTIAKPEKPQEGAVTGLLGKADIWAQIICEENQLKQIYNALLTDLLERKQGLLIIHSDLDYYSVEANIISMSAVSPMGQSLGLEMIFKSYLPMGIASAAPERTIFIGTDELPGYEYAHKGGAGNLEFDGKVIGEYVSCIFDRQ